MALDTYSALIAAIDDWLDRNDLSGSAPDMIALCEARLRRELQPLDLEETASLSIVNGAAFLPLGCDAIRVVAYDGNPLDEVSPEIGRQFAAGSVPAAYSLEGGQIRVWPAWTGAVDLVYHGKLAALGDAQPANSLLLEHPDVYFYGSLMFAEGYLANDSRMALFKTLWDEALGSAIKFYTRQRRDRPRLRNPVVVV